MYIKILLGVDTFVYIMMLVEDNILASHEEPVQKMYTLDDFHIRKSKQLEGINKATHGRYCQYPLRHCKA